MKQTSDVVSIVPRFFQLVETQFSKVIKVFRSDNAPELNFFDFFAKKGTIHQFSCTETPQKIQLWRENTNIFLMWLGLFISNLECLSVSGEIEY